MNLRWLVLKILDGIEFEDTFVHDAIEQFTEDVELTKQERGFIKKVVFGTIENRIYLDYFINQYSKVKVRKMKPAIRHTLRLSLYQLIFMENIPQSAVCNEAVKLIKKRKMFKLTGFVNGVLRSIIRDLDKLTLPDAKNTPVTYLSVKYSFEEKLIQRLLQDFTYDQVEGFLSVSNEEAPLTVRVNRHKGNSQALVKALEQENVLVKPAKWLENAFYMENLDRLDTLKAFRDGLFLVQDESSMLVSVVGYENGMTKVMDVCSAPGGKTAHLSDLVGSAGQVKAFDVNEKKTALIRENMERLGLTNVTIDVGDATVTKEELLGWADLVVADVPCSGLGIIRKKPDIKWHASSDKVTGLAVIQKAILQNVSQYVKVGGTLVYSTCTILPEENEDNVQWFLDNHQEFKLVPIDGPYADSDSGMVKLLPDSNGPDGFFIAKMKRVE